MINQKDIGEYIVYSNGDIYSKYFKRFMFKKQTNNIWYKAFALRTGAKKMTYVHRLIAEAFIPNPENLPCVNHKDGNKRNNDVNNLEWCTDSQNKKHARETGLMKNQVMGSKHKDARFTPLQIKIVREALSSGYPGASIARYFKVNKSSVYRIKTNEHWKQLV